MTTTTIANELNIGIREDVANRAIDVLSRVLADEHVLYVKSRNYHWNVRGPQFPELHALFEEQYEALASHIDATAERIRSLGNHTPGTMTEYLRVSQLRERPADYPDAAGMIEDLLADHEAVIRSLRQAVDNPAQLDAGTVDFMTGMMQDHEKMAWILRAILSR